MTVHITTSAVERHGISREQILAALANELTRVDFSAPSDDEPRKTLIIGFTAELLVLELVGDVWNDGEVAVIYHADRLRKAYEHHLGH